MQLLSRIHLNAVSASTPSATLSSTRSETRHSPTSRTEDEDRNEVDGTCKSEPDAPVFMEDNPDTPEMEAYFDVSSRLVARLAPPGCLLGVLKSCHCAVFTFQDCNAAEFTIRHAFKKVDPNHKYARIYKGFETELFGFFDTMRMEYHSDEQ